MPCWTASSASSRGVQASTGRRNCAGAWQARLMICTICPAVKVAGAPGRGASAKAAAMARAKAGRSASATVRCVAAAAQRARTFFGRAIAGERLRGRGEDREAQAAVGQVIDQRGAFGIAESAVQQRGDVLEARAALQGGRQVVQSDFSPPRRPWGGLGDGG